MLAPYRVLDLTDEWGLLAGAILADLGADVIQIEPPGGSSARRLGPYRDGSGRPEDSLFWAAYARNKRGITLDIFQPEGRELLRRLVASADFVVESFRPGVLEAAGLSYPDFQPSNARLIWGSVTPFGSTGPRAAWPATDLTVTAASNFLLWTGDDDRAPLISPVPQAYLHASAEAAAACLVALLERRRSGLGQRVEASAQAAMAACTQSFILSAAWNDQPSFRLPPEQRMVRMGASGVYPASDGLVVIGFFFGSGLGPLANRMMQWIDEEGMCPEDLRDTDWVGFLPRLTAGEESPEKLVRTRATIEAFTSGRTMSDLFEGALERGLLLAPASTPEDTRKDPHLAARDFWQPSGSLDEDYRYPGPFAKFSATPLQYKRRAPRLGEHNVEVYRDELGLTEDDLRLLAARGVI
jgi:crotonobetainyl-CoA:carnitine CoA-transferase CaiB-like acyl-CoA transferase